MSSHRILAFLVLSSLLPAACARGPLGRLPAPPSLAQTSHAVVIREQVHILGRGVTYLITVDGNEVFGIRHGEYTSLPLVSGRHTIGVRCFGGWTPTWKEKAIGVEFRAGEKFYFLVAPDFSCAEIQELSPEEGAALVSESIYRPY